MFAKPPPNAKPFTKENAGAMQKLGLAAKLAKRDVLSRLDDLTRRLAKLERQTQRRTTQLPTAPPTMTPQDKPNEDRGEFAAVRLERVRANLRRLDLELARETDPLALDRLARAAAALSVQEFALAGRPMPGQRRPGPAKQSPVESVDALPIGRSAEQPPVDPGAVPPEE